MMPDFIAAPSVSEDHKCLSCPSKIEPAGRGYMDSAIVFNCTDLESAGSAPRGAAA